MAALSRVSSERNGVQYHTLPTKSILNHCSNASMPFQWTINPYRGCEYGCKYCYARYTHEFMELRDNLDFERKIYAKENVVPLLRRELTPNRLRGKPVAIGTATDPYQPAERQFAVTRKILEVIATLSGLTVSITTKSNLVLRDLKLLKEITANNHFQVNISITTCDPNLSRILEPRAPRPDLRFKAVKTLSENGISAGVFMMPLLPGITTPEKNLDAVVQRSAESKAQFLHSSVVFLMPCAQVHFFPFLKTHFPKLFQRYKEVFSRSAFLSKDYQREVQAKVEDLKKKYAIPPSSTLETKTVSPYEDFGRQLDLRFS